MKPLSIVIILVGAGTLLFMSCERLKNMPQNPPAASQSTTGEGGSGYAPEAGGESANESMTFDDAVGL